MYFTRFNTKRYFLNFRWICDRCYNTEHYISVQEFYQGRSVFITGCTGFIGQCLVEKLLRSCPEIKRIYLPIRATKSSDTRQRFEKFLNSSVFTTLRTTHPDFAHKLVPLEASFGHPNLGLSDHDLATLTGEVSVIFHLAADIKFNPPLREAIQSNILSATNVFRFGKTCQHLAAYVHTSTLVAHLDRQLVEEKIYPTKWDHNKLIGILEKEIGLSRKIKTEIRGKHPSLYHSTKKVSEYMTQLEGGSSPVAVVRPGFICPALQEPYPGWSFGSGSFIPWFKLVEKGDVKILPASDEFQLEISPVDLCANQIIIVACYLGTKKYDMQESRETLVVNQHSQKLRHLNSSYFVRCVNQCLQNEGRNDMVFSDTSRSRLAVRIVIPTMIKTIQDYFRGDKPRTLFFYLFILLEKGYYKTLLNNNLKEYKNLDKIISCLSNEDKNKFPSDLAEIDWEAYIRMWFETVKKKREEIRST